MKRIEPVRSGEDSGYPTAREAGVNRRGFMQVIVASSAAAVGSVVLGEDRARARGVIRRPRYRVAIDLKPPFTYKGCKSAIVQIVASTYDDRFHGFLQEPGERSGVMAAIRGALLSHKCADMNGSGRYKMARTVATALQKRYKRRTGRSGGYSWVSFVVKPKK